MKTLDDGTKRKTMTKKSVHTEYFTNLTEEEMSRQEIIHLYHDDRWDIETSYDVLKNYLEVEAVHTANPIAIINEFYGKAVLFNMDMVIYSLACTEIEESGVRDSVPNCKRILEMVYNYPFMKRFNKASLRAREILQILKEAVRSANPVRKGRHVKRWNRYFKRPPQKKISDWRQIQPESNSKPLRRLCHNNPLAAVVKPERRITIYPDSPLAIF